MDSSDESHCGSAGWCRAEAYELEFGTPLNRPSRFPPSRAPKNIASPCRWPGQLTTLLQLPILHCSPGPSHYPKPLPLRHTIVFVLPDTFGVGRPYLSFQTPLLSRMMAGQQKSPHVLIIGAGAQSPLRLACCFTGFESRASATRLIAFHAGIVGLLIAQGMKKVTAIMWLPPWAAQ